MTSKLIFSVLLLIVSATLSAQATLDWKPCGEIPVAEEDIWSVDVLGNVYVSNFKKITKYDSTLRVRFSQSIKSLGALSAVEPMNTMKLVAFSEEQQSICVLDNTLTLSEACIDLSQHGILNATKIAISAQPDKLWVFDQLNSRLQLMSLGSVKQSQEVRNMQGITGIGEIVKMEENQNELYISNREGKIFVFDIYGTLKWVVNASTLVDFTVYNGNIMRIIGDKIVVFQGDEEIIDWRFLPIKDVKEFHFSGGFYYFRTADKILKYSVSWR
ncbi:MAG: hypothetical protein RL632_280 [Bacteroidota bacterium]